MDAPERSSALIGEGRAKSSSVQIRKERARRARQTAPGERRTLFVPFDSLREISIYLTEFLQKEIQSEVDPQKTRGRHAAGGEADFAASSSGFDNAR